MLSQGSGRLDAPTASPVVLLPASGRFPQPLEAMKEKEVHPKQVKVRAGGSRVCGVDGPPCAAAVIALWVPRQGACVTPQGQLRGVSLCSNVFPYGERLLAWGAWDQVSQARAQHGRWGGGGGGAVGESCGSFGRWGPESRTSSSCTCCGTAHRGLSGVAVVVNHKRQKVRLIFLD